MMIPNSSPHNQALTMLSRAEGRYLATNHNDTSPGSVHCFQDEHGECLDGTRLRVNAVVVSISIDMTLHGWIFCYIIMPIWHYKVISMNL